MRCGSDSWMLFPSCHLAGLPPASAEKRPKHCSFQCSFSAPPSPDLPSAVPLPCIPSSILAFPIKRNLAAICVHPIQPATTFGSRRE